MTAKELKEALVNVPDDTEILMDLGGIKAIGVCGTELDEYQNAFFIY